MNFESRLSDGEFCILECVKCKKIVWPPAEFCNHCFGIVNLKRGNFEGKIIEFSQKDDQYFCMVEFEGSVRIMASISDAPNIEQTVRISRCGISNGSYFFQVI